jgi:uncharacterized cofD-like protein
VSRSGGAGGRRLIVGIGGGRGLSALLAGCKRLVEAGRAGSRPPVEVVAIVTVADDGGSTGALRRELGIPAVGDLRNCLVAASQGNPLWRDLFQHRFTEGDGLGGHALGNLVMAALTQSSGGLLPALERLARPLRLCGRVLPVTESRVTLCAELDDGETVCGESRIPRPGRRIERVWLSPADAAPARGVLEAIADADAIVLGPGSLFTSVVPNLLVPGVAEAIRASDALRIFACNLMTEPGETEGFDAARHLQVLHRYLGERAVDVCLMNGRRPSIAESERFGAAGAARPVAWPSRAAWLEGAMPFVADLVPDGEFQNRHDPGKLAEAVVSLARCLRRQAPGAASYPTPRWAQVAASLTARRRA